MRSVTVFALAVLASLLLVDNVLAQAGQGRRGAGGFGMMAQDEFQQTIAALGEVNLRPDFTLTKEQKEKIQAIRDNVRKAEAKWREDNAQALNKMQEDMRSAMQDQDQDKMRDVMTKRRELMQTMPKTDDAVKQVKDVLTADQAQALEARIKERQQEMRGRMGMGAGRGGRGGGGGGGNQ